MNLAGKNIVVYDLEIEHVIDGKDITWNDHDKMGLSVGCLYDFRTDDYSVYFKADIQPLCGRLNETGTMIVAFNQIGFDNKLLRALGGDLKPDSELNNYDMLLESRKAVGWTEKMRFPSGLKLDDHLEATFGKDQMKTAHGALAPKWWSAGRRGEVVTYCLADVKRERMLFQHIVDFGWAQTKAHGKQVFRNPLVI